MLCGITVVLPAAYCLCFVLKLPSSESVYMPSFLPHRHYFLSLGFFVKPQDSQTQTKVHPTAYISELQHITNPNKAGLGNLGHLQRTKPQISNIVDVVLLII